MVIIAKIAKEWVLAEKSDQALELYNKSRFGEPVSKTQIQYSLVEALYLIEKNKLKILSGKKEINFDLFLKKAQRLDKDFWTRYIVYKDMRNRGYIIKTALKFGADFRVYDKGIKPGQDHAKWVLYPVNEAGALKWREYSAKNRVAHSTKKRLLLGIVDDEGDVTYYEVSWVRP